MFSDYAGLSERSARQQQRYDRFLARAEEPLLAIELGAGTAIPTIRHLSQHLVRRSGGRLIRINLREPQVPALACSAARQ